MVYDGLPRGWTPAGTLYNSLGIYYFKETGNLWISMHTALQSLLG